MLNFLIKPLRRFWFHSIRRQLALSFALVTALLLLAFGYGMMQHERKFLMEQSTSYVGDLAHMLSLSSASAVLSNDLVGLQEQVHGMLRSPHLRYAMVLSPEGRVLASTQKETIGRYVQDGVSRRLLTQTELQRVVLVDDDAMVDVAVPVHAGKQLAGWVRIGWGREEVRASLNDSTRRGYAMAAASIALTVLLALAMSRRLTTSLRQLMHVANQVYAGRRDVRAEVTSADEVGTLAASFNRMLDALAKSEREQEHLNQVLYEAEERLRFALEGAGDSVWEWNVRDDELILSERWKEIFGFDVDRKAIRSKEWTSRIHPEDVVRVRQNMRAHLGGGDSSYTSEYRVLARDGGWKWLLARGMLASMTEDGQPLRMVGIHSDITERKLAEESMQLASLVYQATSEALIVYDSANRIVAINPAFTKVTNYSAEELIGQSTDMLRSNHHEPAFHLAMQSQIEATGQWQGEAWCRRKNGESVIGWVTVNTICNPDGSVHRRVALFTDLTEKKLSDELIWQQANFNPLTGLPNRRMFNDRLEQEIRKGHRTGLPLGILLLDLDRFKEINDTLGHEIGDALLRQAAARLTACMRETDTVAHLGGDEFSIILGQLEDPGCVERIAQNILQEMAEPYLLGEEKAYVSASIGITFFPEDAVDIETLLKNADQAMYAAKHQGRNRYHYFTPTMQETAQTRMRLANDLRGALAGDQFRVVYQPIVALDSGVIHKAEALIRWQHPVRGLISPAQFIPIAEETGLIDDIGEWIFRQAAHQAAHWRKIYHPQFQISVNKSPVQFGQGDKQREKWSDYLARHELSGNSIAVEITEGLLMDASAAVTDQLLQFRDAGIQVALDDFGTGYSALSYLKKFDIDYIKIDQSFVRNLAPGSNDLALCEAIIVMAHKLGMKVIAEGVETREQRDLLALAGCDYAQGFLFSRPVPASEFEQVLQRSNSHAMEAIKREYVYKSLSPAR